jgi:hypothetical protein
MRRTSRRCPVCLLFLPSSLYVSLSLSVCLCLSVRLSVRSGHQEMHFFFPVTAPYHAKHDTPINKSCICRPSLITLRPLPAPDSPTAQFLASFSLRIVLPRSPRLGLWQPPPTAPEHQCPFLTASFSDLPTPPERPWKPQVMCAAPWRRRRRYGVRTQQNIVAVRGSAA